MDVSVKVVDVEDAVVVVVVVVVVVAVPVEVVGITTKVEMMPIAFSFSCPSAHVSTINV